MDRRQAWEENYKKIKKQYPSVDQISWSDAVGRDIDAFASVLGDVIKAEGKRSRPGKRPSLSRSQAEEEFAKLSGANYSEVEFTQAFKALTRGRSVRGIANKVGISPSAVYKLQQGASPSFEQMEKIAAAYKKDPHYFLEYRVAYVLLVIESFLMDSPETATVWYSKLRSHKKLRLS